MVRLCLFLILLLRKLQDGIHMPLGFVDDLEGGIADKEVRYSTLGNDILSADEDGSNILFLNVVEYHAFAITGNFGGLLDRECIAEIFQSLVNMCLVCIPAIVREGDIALGNRCRIHWLVVDFHPSPCRLGVEDPHGDLLTPLDSFLLQIGFHILAEDDISVRFGRSDLARDNAVVQHPRRLALTDVEHLVELFQ